MLRKLCMILLLLKGFNVNYFAQDNELGKDVISDGREFTYFPDSIGTYYATTVVGGDYNPSIVLSRYENYKLVESDTVKSKFDTGRARLEGAVVVQGKIVLFLRSRDKKVEHFYYSIFNRNCDLEESKKLFECDKTYQSDRYAIPSRITWSENKQYFCFSFCGIDGEIGFKAKLVKFLTYTVFDKNLQIKHSNFRKMDDTNLLESYTGFYLTNNGTLLVNEVKYKPQRIPYSQLEKITVLAFDEQNGCKEVITEIPSLMKKGFISLSFCGELDEVISCVGLYGYESVVTHGLYSATLNLSTNELSDEKFVPFSKEKSSVDVGSSSNDWIRNTSRENRDKFPEETVAYIGAFGNYELNSSFTIGDGSKLFLFDYRAIYEFDNGKTIAMIHKFEEMLLVSLDAKGKLNWSKSIARQMDLTSVDVNCQSIPVCSVSRDEKNLIILFNDHNKNYGDDGIYLGKKPKTLDSNYKTSRLVRVDVNSYTGEHSRRLLLAEANKSIIAQSENIQFHPELNEFTVMYCGKYFHRIVNLAY